MKDLEKENYPAENQIWRSNNKGIVYEILYVANINCKSAGLPERVVFKKLCGSKVYCVDIKNFVNSAYKAKGKKFRTNCGITGRIKWEYSET